jgi:hypothetical protein
MRWGRRVSAGMAGTVRKGLTLKVVFRKKAKLLLSCSVLLI